MMYLNYAAFCPTRTEVEQEIQFTLAQLKAYLYSESGIHWYRTTIQQSRESVARLLNVSKSEHVAFVPNASTANYFLLSSIDWKPGDIILSTTHENPSIRDELLALHPKGVDILFLTPTSTPQQFLASIQQMLREHAVRAIVLSHVSHVDGRIFPIAGISALSKEFDCLLIVDGAQAVGHIPVDVQNLDCDAYFFSGHKWCSGPVGTGGLVIQEGFWKRHPRLTSLAPTQKHLGAIRFEIGTQNLGLIAGLAKACDLKYEEGLGLAQLSQLRELATQTLGNLTALNVKAWMGPQAPGIFTFQCQPPEDHHRLSQQLQSSWDIVAKTFVDYPEQDVPCIRLSWSTTTGQNVVEATLDHIKQCLSTS